MILFVKQNSFPNFLNFKVLFWKGPQHTVDSRDHNHKLSIGSRYDLSIWIPRAGDLEPTSYTRANSTRLTSMHNSFLWRWSLDVGFSYHFSAIYYADCLGFLSVVLEKQEDRRVEKEGDGFPNPSFFSPITRRCPRCSIQPYWPIKRFESYSLRRYPESLAVLSRTEGKFPWSKLAPLTAAIIQW